MIIVFIGHFCSSLNICWGTKKAELYHPLEKEAIVENNYYSDLRKEKNVAIYTSSVRCLYKDQS